MFLEKFTPLAKKFYTPAVSNASDKFHLWLSAIKFIALDHQRATKLKNTKHDINTKHKQHKIQQASVYIPSRKGHRTIPLLKYKNTHLLSIIACFNHQQP